MEYSEKAIYQLQETEMKKCAIYTRVSTSMQAEKDYNSCEAQRDKILSYIKSQEDLEVYKEYSDAGYSGGSIERPALSELLRDISRGLIQSVLTYKIDRFTRSSKDFYSLIEFLEKYNVAFVSVTERFDTSSPAGRLLRNIMLTFAQFEREMIVERTKDKMLQRAEKGLWNGGGIPLGYKLEGGKLLVNKEKANQIKEIFETFVLTESIARTLDFAKAENIKTGRKNLPMSMSTLWNILRNPRYIGYMKYSGKLYKTDNEPIISEELFEQAKSLRNKKVIKQRLYKEYPLARLIACSECGSNMTPSFSNKPTRRYYYYKCYKVVREANACGLKAVNAEKIEAFLIDNLSRLAQDKQYIETLAFKIAHETGARKGFELRGVCPQELSTRVSEVLINFKNKIKKSTQVEKCLLFKKTISRINFSKESLEVIVSLIDTSSPLSEGRNDFGVGVVGAKKREGAVNPDAPACITGSLLNLG